MRLPPLHDVDDPEALCQSILTSVLAGNGGHWSAVEREDVVQDMRVLIWRLAERYDASRTSMTFCTYATWILRKRAGVDAYRTRLVDRRYQTERAPDLSLDELLEHLDRSIALEENDEEPDREQADLLTRLACATTTRDVPAAEAFENWRLYLQPEEAAA